MDASVEGCAVGHLATPPVAFRQPLRPVSQPGSDGDAAAVAVFEAALSAEAVQVTPPLEAGGGAVAVLAVSTKHGLCGHEYCGHEFVLGKNRSEYKYVCLPTGLYRACCQCDDPRAKQRAGQDMKPKLDSNLKPLAPDYPAASGC